MTIKWNKAMCIEYSSQLKSRLEEIMQQSGNGQKPRLQQLGEKIRQAISARKPSEV